MLLFLVVVAKGSSPISCRNIPIILLYILHDVDLAQGPQAHDVMLSTFKIHS